MKLMMRTYCIKLLRSAWKQGPFSRVEPSHCLQIILKQMALHTNVHALYAGYQLSSYEVMPLHHSHTQWWPVSIPLIYYRSAFNWLILFSWHTTAAIQGIRFQKMMELLCAYKRCCHHFGPPEYASHIQVTTAVSWWMLDGNLILDAWHGA